MTPESIPVSLFLSYAHEDEPLLRQLEVHLSLLKRQGLISVWHDRQIVPGTDWAREIDERLEQASIILLLVSADFLASDYCYQIEVRRALERQQAGQAIVIPIVLRPTDWLNAPFAHLQALPANARAVTTWPNRDEAFVNVANGIRQAIAALPALSAATPRSNRPVVWNIPYLRNPFFLGRDDLLLRLHDQLRTGQAAALSQSPQAISGLGGIGKTQIAIEYAYRYYYEYKVVLWMRADTHENLTSSYLAAASLLNLPEKDLPESTRVIAAVKAWLQTYKGWLLILDNADDLALIRDFLPPHLSGHVLLTTRSQAMGGLAHRLEVDILSTELGALFLLRRAGRLASDATLQQIPEPERTLAYNLCQELGGLPLALDQAGAYIEETGCSLAEYLHLFQMHRARLLAERRGLIDDHPQPVATTWSLAFVRIEQKNPAAVDLLRLCAILAPDDIPEVIISEGGSHLGRRLAPLKTDPYQIDQAIEALRAYSLLRRENSVEAGFRLSVHRLVQAVLKDAMSLQEQQEWLWRAIKAIRASCPEVEYANWGRYELLLPHIQACALLAEQQRGAIREAAQLFSSAGYYLTERARYKEAEGLLRLAVRISEQLPNPDSYERADSIKNLASFYRRLGRIEEALLYYRQAARLCEQLFGPDHLNTSSCLHSIAIIFDYQGKDGEAEALYQRILTARKKQLGPDHPDLAYALSGLADLYNKRRKYKQAEPLMKQALAIREQGLGPMHPKTASSLESLANLYANQRRYSDAEPLYQRALMIYEQQQGLNHPDVAGASTRLANLYTSQGKYSQAESLYQRALTIYRQVYDWNHIGVQNTRGRYALLLRKLGRQEEAKKLE